MVEIKWLKASRNDLFEIYRYISKDSHIYAKRQVDRIRGKTRILKTQPDIGKITPELGDASIRELIEGNYRIIYRIVSDDLIHILMVHHGARDLYKRL